MKDLNTLKNLIKQLFGILNGKQIAQMWKTFFVIIIGSLFELLGVSAMLPFVQSILSPEELMSKRYIFYFCKLFSVTDIDSVVICVGVGIVIIYIIKNLYLSYSKYIQARYCNNTRKDLAVLMMKSYLNRSYSDLVDIGTGAISRGVNSCSEGVYQVIFNLFSLVSEMLVVSSVAVYLFFTDWLLAMGVLLVGMSCLLAIVFGLKRKISSSSVLYRNSLEIMSKWFYQITGGIKDILVYCRQSFFLEGYGKAYGDTAKSMTLYTFICCLPERIIEMFCASGIIIIVLIRVRMGVDVNAFVPNMAVFAMGAFRLLPSISRTTGYVNALVYYRGFVEEAYSNMQEARLYQDELDSRSNESREIKDNNFIASNFNKIEICNLCWKYKDGERNVLDDLSFSIRKGEAIGVVGASGSGKSTLADVILRLYHPQNGCIKMDGINIETIPTVWSRTIGYVPQSVFLVDDTIRENVVFGADDADDVKVWDALYKSSLKQFVESLPMGLDTIVGERGVKFSGGQRQRIAIARALYAKPQILILDEATSALDNETEEAVMEAIDSLAGTITLIIIAHRLTTLKGCDKIYEIVGGKAIERDKTQLIGSREEHP